MAAPVSTESLVWIAATGGESVSDPVVAGSANDGNEVHVACAEHEDEVALGKLHVGHPHAYIPYHNEEISKETYQVLSNPGGLELEWVSASDGTIPRGAVCSGRTGVGEPFFVGRVTIDGECVAGKILPEFKCCFSPYGGKEHDIKEYEVLCVKSVKVESKES